MTACGGGGGAPGVGQIPPGDKVEVPADPAEQFTLAAPADVGMDAATLDLAVSALPPNNGISAMLVMRHGRPVLEQYWNGYERPSPATTGTARRRATRRRCTAPRTGSGSD